MGDLNEFLSVPITIGFLLIFFVPFFYKVNRRITALEDEIRELKKKITELNRDY
ncbi:hypothetical protein [Tuberibacillus calidus]|uniref:hypothetical protein n=1 Tax=Tuberibacillus calidus TaxID=340097 RepID=UPI0012DF669C|nr:hypothetical protein [Tuberibacillus calidus]